jgi:hypothetical protein
MVHSYAAFTVVANVCTNHAVVFAAIKDKFSRGKNNAASTTDFELSSTKPYQKSECRGLCC